MEVRFENLNNNDTEHKIIFRRLTTYSNGTEIIGVLFDGNNYSSKVHFDEKSRTNFKHCGKTYGFEIVKE